jgi:alpha-L-rhamnosidase
MKNFPEQRTRIEGHFEEQFNPALINADGCDGLVIDGSGTLDGAGKPIWDLFWKLRAGNNEFKNLDVPRARLCIIGSSRNVTVKGITFKDAQFWNLHLYKCQGVTVEDARFVVPDNDKPPSSDGVDVDSCQDVTIKGCYFSVNDDCIALKGTKGPFAMDDKTSPPVERIRVSNCVFNRGHGVVTCGSEATIVRDVIVEDCEVKGSMPLVRLKLRPDTPQRYEDFIFRNISIESDGATIFQIKKWSQYFDPMGQPEPSSVVRNIAVANITGSIGSMGVIQGNEMTDIHDISLSEVDVTAQSAKLDVSDQVKNLKLDGVKVNGEPFLVE